MSYSFVAGNVLTAAQMNLLAPVYVIKQADQTVSASTTLVNDSELALSFSTTGVTYYVETRLGFTAPTAGDIKVAYARTGTLTQMAVRSVLGPTLGTTDNSNTAVVMQHGYALASAVSYGGDGTHTGYLEEKFFIRVDVAGILTVQWAQAAASGSTVVKAGSTIMATPVAM